MWQFDGQWCMTSDHVSAEGGSVPSCGSVAEPANAITSPTLHVVDPDGAVIVAVGGIEPAWITTDFVPTAP